VRLRDLAPLPVRTYFNQDVKIGGVDFKKNKTTFIVNMHAILNDPVQWINPREFNPDRFDSKSEWFKRPDGTPRNPLAFCPFSGGKRICAGRTFAEIMLCITIPLIYYHFEFEFTRPDQKTNKPNYQISAAKNPEMPFKVKQIRKVVF
jgi:cytochrome P450